MGETGRPGGEPFQAQRALLQLIGYLVEPHDRTGNELREQRHIECKIEGIA